MSQLSFDGTEISASAVLPARTSSPELTPTQRGVLEHLRAEGSITPKDAGLILYANQGTPWRAPYASSDGFEVLRRLALRGLVHKEGRGRWVGGPGQAPRLRRSELRRRGGFSAPVPHAEQSRGSGVVGGEALDHDERRTSDMDEAAGREGQRRVAVDAEVAASVVDDPVAVGGRHRQHASPAVPA